MGRFRVDAVTSTGSEQGGADLTMILIMLLTALCFLLRFTRLFVSIYANLTFKPIPVPAFPTYTPKKDVTVIIPTVYKNPSELAECIGRIDRCGPSEIFIVVLESNVSSARALCDANKFSNVTVLGVPKLGKRTQMLRALEFVKTRIIVWADDDVFIPDDYLVHMLAAFENPKPSGLWWILGAGYILRRRYNNAGSQAIDGSISTLSGRCAAYRTEILQCEEFMSGPNGFAAGSFMGKKLDSDDDKFLTRWVYSHSSRDIAKSRDLSPDEQMEPGEGWQIAIQTAVYLETSLEENWGYIHQCLRWARARFRGNFTVMNNETYWCSRRYAWGCYIIYFSMFQQPSLFVDLGFAYLLSLILAPCSADTQSLCWILFLVWVLFTKIVRLIPHFLRHPIDMVHIPMLVAFGYFHGFLNIYALCTLTQTAWGGKDIAALSKDKPEKDETAPLLESNGQFSIV